MERTMVPHTPGEPVEGFWLHRGDKRGWERVTQADYVTQERLLGFRRADTSSMIATRAFTSPDGTRGQVTDPTRIDLPAVLEPIAGDLKVYELEQRLRRAQDRIERLNVELETMRRMLNQRDSEVLARLAPAIAERLRAGVTRLVMEAIQKEG